MRLMSSSDIFLTKRDYLVIRTNVFGGSLDEENIVYLTHICFSGGARYSSSCGTSHYGFDFSCCSGLWVLSPLFWSLRLWQTSIV